MKARFEEPRETFNALGLSKGTEAASRGVLWKKVFLEIFRPQTCNFIEKETLAQAFSCEFCEIFKKRLLYRTPPDDCLWK